MIVVLLLDTMNLHGYAEQQTPFRLMERLQSQ
jgi:hypothetical protein